MLFSLLLATLQHVVSCDSKNSLLVVFWCSDQISTTCSCRVTFLGSSSLDLSPSFALPVVFHLNNDMIFFGFNRISHFVFGRNKCMCSSSHVLCYGRMQSNANHNFDLYGGTSFVLVTLTTFKICFGSQQILRVLPRHFYVFQYLLWQKKCQGN